MPARDDLVHHVAYLGFHACQVVTGWLAEREAWLRRHGIDPSRADWETRLRALPANVAHEFKRHVSDRWNDRLDALHGACVLRRAELASMVAQSLRHFDEERYLLTDYVVMPNHVHLLASLPEEIASRGA